MEKADVLVRGTGIVGQSLALALARAGLRVALRDTAAAAAAAPAPAGRDDTRAEGRTGSRTDVRTDVRADVRTDVRAFALNAASIALLRELKVWDSLPLEARTAVHDMQVHGDAAGASIEFSAWQQRVGELAWITDAALLERELATAVGFAANITRVDADVPTALVALCEGKDSQTRERLGVALRRVDYRQSAIAARLVSDRAHAGVARQWFTPDGVLALLPFDMPSAGHSYALVWSLADARADATLALDAPAFEQALQAASFGTAGSLTLASERARWPLSMVRAERWCGPGWVLLGDAAHVVHPLAGQGLNLGLADVKALARVIAQREPWRPLGDEKLLRRYVRERAAPTLAMTLLTDAIENGFTHPAPLVRQFRNRALNLVDRLAPLKRWLAARALDA